MNPASSNRRCSIHAISPQDIATADIVLLHDTMTLNETVVFGRERLQRIAETGTTERLAVLMVELDQETDELEWLIAAVRVVKGYDEYQSAA